MYLGRCVYTCVLERDVSESVFSCVQPVLIDKCHRVPALGGVCISECVGGTATCLCRRIFLAGSPKGGLYLPRGVLRLLGCPAPVLRVVP